MARIVQGPDDRVWEVHSRINWSQPATEDEFEHDMAAGYVSGIAMLVVIVALILFVVFWTPSGVFVPSWLVLLFLLLLMVLPMQWAMRRPWTIVARTAETVATSGEHWEGTTHGVREARYETRQVVRNLKQRSNPDDGTGLLRQVT
ncbi:MAG TPA: DUF983 domain-containing protein [Pseudonocardiaceae bacterium]|nr:DUF983 domain-containing protein [Pseudonocardiaceae bacterium]